MTDEAATPEDETTDEAVEAEAEGTEGGGGGAAAPGHSPSPSATAQDVPGGSDTADDGSPDTAPAGEAVSEPTAGEAVAEDAPAPEDEPAGDATVEGPAATSEPSPEGSGSEAEQPSVSEAKDELKVPGADLEPIALEELENLSAEERARLEAEAEEERARREAELAAEKAEEEIPVREPAKLDEDARFRATGKRKSAIARVILQAGSGEITVNGRPLEEYFPRPLHQTMVRQPLNATGYGSGVAVRVRVHGGGISGQAAAIRHGIARALTEVDSELRGDLKRRGYLTRDARVKERRKAGLKKARKRPQFSKR